MKPWPKHSTAVVSIDELLEPLRRAIARMCPRWMSEVPASAEADGEYIGYGIPSSAHVASSPVTKLTKAGLEFERGQGRDAFDLALTIAFQLGIEQGIRLHRSKVQLHVRVLRAVADHVMAESATARVAELRATIDELDRA